MSRRVQENLIAAVFLVLFAGVIVLSLQFGPRARMIPLPLAIFGLVLTVIQIAWQNLRSIDELQIDMFDMLVSQPENATVAKAEAPAEAATSAQSSSWRREAGAYGIVAALLSLILLVGPLPAIFVFTGGYFFLSKHYSWRRGLIYTVILTAMVYLLFVAALGIQLYHGLLEPLVERMR